MTTRVITVGIGGASSTGKSTLAKQLGAVIPECTIIHQDDYWSNPEDCVVHPIYNEPYLEDPPTAIDWPLFRTKVQQLKTTTECSDVSRWPEESDSGSSHDSDIIQPRDESPDDYGKLPDDLVAEWRQRFRELDGECKSQGIQLKWYIVEGWHLYYDPEVVEELDVRLLIRCSNNVVRKRRDKRAWKQQGEL